MRKRTFNISDIHHSKSAASFAAFIFMLFCVQIVAFSQTKKGFSFKFNPTNDAISYSIDTKIIRDKSVDTQKRVDVIDLKTQASIKKEPFGYLMNLKPQILSLKRDGIDTIDPLLSIMYEGDFSFILNSKGELDSVTGFDNVENQIKNSFPPEYHQAMSKIITTDVLENSAVENWFSAISGYLGSTVSINDEFSTINEYPLPSGEALTYFTIASIYGEVECDEHNCLEIHYRYTSNPDDVNRVEELLEDFLAEMGEETEEFISNMKFSGTNISGNGVIIIDPTTMLIYKEHYSKTIKMKISIPGFEKDVESVSITTIDSIYSY